MSRNGKVIIAMSGGVDSSVAACLLKEQGYECIGVFMRVGGAGDDPQISQNDAEMSGACSASSAPAAEAPGCAVPSEIQFPKSNITLPQRRLRHGCCSATDALDARLIAGKLGIPFYALNFEPDFGRIVDYFVDEYGRARTPNPCVMCNIHLKFGKLLKYAEMMEAEFVATGHYARIMSANAECRMQNAEGGPAASARAPDPSANCIHHSALRSAGPFLARAVNLAKDQSYVLFGIRRDDLRRCMFPLGGFAEKAEVRGIAAGLGLRVHDKPDSQEICFVPGNDYARLFDARRPGERQPGDIRDARGIALGRHAGYQRYTIGQRRGLGLARGEPVYVTGIDATTNTITVGPRDELLAPGLIADDINWLIEPPLSAASSGAAPTDASVRNGDWLSCAIKIRHMHTPAPGRIRAIAAGAVEACFDTPQPAVTPGQAAVFYAGEVVLGGGWIRAATT